MENPDLENWLRTELFDKVPGNIAIINRKYRIVKANKNFTDEFGEWHGKYCFEMFRGQDIPCLSCNAMWVFADGKGRNAEEWRLNGKGKYSCYSVQIEPIIDERGYIPYLMEISRDITETWMVQREHDILFDQAPYYVAVIDDNMNVVRHNDLFRKTFGESTGKKCYEIYQHRHEQCQDCPARLTFVDGQIYAAYKKKKDKEGNIVHYHIITTPLYQGGKKPKYVIEMALDLTRTRMLQREHDILFDRVPCYVAVIDQNLDIIRSNELFRKTFGDPGGKKCYEIYQHRQEPCQDCPAKRSLADGRTHSASKQGLDKEGHPVYYHVTTAPLAPSDDGQTHVIEMALDVTETRRLEAEKLDAERLAAVGETVAGLAHGIKNVLMCLDGGLYVLNSGMKKDNKELASKGWVMLKDNIERITTYVQDFLNFAKGQAPTVERTDPVQIAREVFDLHKGVAEQTGIALTCELQEDIAPANFDHEGIHTCLTNLISNAIDACEMSDNPNCGVHIRLFEEKDTIIYEVSDNGCGMDYEVKKKVFTSFFSTKGTTRGTGLGLLVTRRITQQHGGKVKLESTEGKGSVFRLEFPRQRLPEVISDKK